RDSARERWERMSPDEREQMHARFDKFQHMDDPQRRAVIERWQRLQQFERGAREALPEDSRRELAQLGPHDQRDAWHGLLGQKWFDRGRAMREMMPQDWRDRFERAQPRDVEALVGEFMEHVRRRAEYALHDMARELHLEPAEVERLRNLPEDQRRAEMFTLRRRQIEQRVAQ